jgi:hypothetical protein
MQVCVCIVSIDCVFVQKYACMCVKGKVGPYRPCVSIGWMV